MPTVIDANGQCVIRTKPQIEFTHNDNLKEHNFWERRTLPPCAGANQMMLPSTVAASETNFCPLGPTGRMETIFPRLSERIDKQ